MDRGNTRNVWSSGLFVAQILKSLPCLYYSLELFSASVYVLLCKEIGIHDIRNSMIASFIHIQTNNLTSLFVMVTSIVPFLWQLCIFLFFSFFSFPFHFVLIYKCSFFFIYLLAIHCICVLCLSLYKRIYCYLMMYT